MVGRETSVGATRLIESGECYFGTFDVDSPANRPGTWDAEFQAARRKAGRREWGALYFLNQSWVDFAEEGALLSWTTLFDGVFKVEVRVLAEEPKVAFGKEEKEHFLGEGKDTLLHCPSGNIVVDSLT